MNISITLGYIEGEYGVHRRGFRGNRTDHEVHRRGLKKSYQNSLPPPSILSLKHQRYRRI